MRLISDFCVFNGPWTILPFHVDESSFIHLFSEKPNCGLVFSPTKMHVKICKAFQSHGCSVRLYLPPDLCRTLLWLWLQRVPSALLKGLGHLCSSWNNDSNMCGQGQLLAVINTVLICLSYSALWQRLREPATGIKMLNMFSFLKEMFTACWTFVSAMIQRLGTLAQLKLKSWIWMHKRVENIDLLRSNLL